MQAQYIRDRNGHSNHQKVMKQGTKYEISHTHITTEAMTTAPYFMYQVYDIVSYKDHVTT